MNYKTKNKKSPLFVQQSCSPSCLSPFVDEGMHHGLFSGSYCCFNNFVDSTGTSTAILMVQVSTRSVLSYQRLYYCVDVCDCMVDSFMVNLWRLQLSLCFISQKSRVEFLGVSTLNSHRWLFLNFSVPLEKERGKCEEGRNKSFLVTFWALSHKLFFVPHLSTYNTGIALMFQGHFLLIITPNESPQYYPKW